MSERKNITRNARRPKKSNAPLFTKHSHTNYDKLRKEQEVMRVQISLFNVK